MADRFLALDVETANFDFSSICSIGVVTFEKGHEVDSWYSLVDPEDYFSGWHVSIHGIDEVAVRGAPTFKSISGRLGNIIAGQVVVTHTHFDRAALKQAHERYGIGLVSCRWLDSARVIRRAWPDQFAQSGYGLKRASNWAGIEFNHHHAEEDARAAGLLVLKAMQDSGLSPEDWLSRVKQPIHGWKSSAKVSLQGNPEGPLHGEQVCFTGTLTLPRRDAAAIAADAGCDVHPGVT
jgi:DNA polymerase-3 subunit epsilon